MLMPTSDPVPQVAFCARCETECRSSEAQEVWEFMQVHGIVGFRHPQRVPAPRASADVLETQ